MITIQEALVQATQALTQARQASNLPVENPRLDAQVLLSYLLGKERSYLYTYPEQILNSEQERCWQELVARRTQGEPVAYIVGHKAFFGLDFSVDRRVLIPRPETELLVEQALTFCQQRLDRGETPVVADIGTGSGVIPISLAVTERRLSSLYACDTSLDALVVASRNCQRHHVEDRVHLLHGDLLSPLPEPVDLLLANLPYVGTIEQPMMLPDVLDFEPELALFSGQEGLDLLQRLLKEAREGRYLRENAVLLLEIGYRQGEILTGMAKQLWPDAIMTLRADLAGWDRLLQIETRQ